MRIRVTEKSQDGLKSQTRALLDKTLSSLCGLSKEIGLSLRSSTDPRLVVAGGHMCGVHLLTEIPDPGAQSYHIGGVGRTLNEAVVKTAGETHERYCQMVSERIIKPEHKDFASFQQMLAGGKNVVGFQFLDIFSEKQKQRANFPFAAISPDDPVGWVEATDAITLKPVWIPAQLTFLGYKPARDEPRYGAAVTTGTSAHPDSGTAMLSSLLELIQVDAAMKHWYGSGKARFIEPDHRLKDFNRWLGAVVVNHGARPEFYHIESDLPGFYCACVYRNRQKAPHVAVGLGASMSLTSAMQKALFEATGVLGLARVLCATTELINVDEMFDLDSNVAWYGRGNHSHIVNEKFDKEKSVVPSSLAPDFTGGSREAIRLIRDSFQKKGFSLCFYDLQSLEARQAGLHVPRFWSPDLLPLCLPSAVPLRHPGFSGQGSIHEQAHPYP